jgi:hypothetical protein
VPSEELQNALSQKELMVAQQKARHDDLLDNLRSRETAFKESQAYKNSMVEELKGLEAEYLRL